MFSSSRTVMVLQLRTKQSMSFVHDALTQRRSYLAV